VKKSWKREGKMLLPPLGDFLLLLSCARKLRLLEILGLCFFNKSQEEKEKNAFH